MGVIKVAYVNVPRVSVIVNAHAGKPSMTDIASRLTAAFAASGIAAEVLVARTGSEVATHAAQAVVGKPALIVAGGGDGTLSTVAANIVGTPTALGILPLGTLNHFAKDLGIPLEVDAAVAVIAAGNTTVVDVGTVNDRIFLNNSSLGLYPRLVRVRERQEQSLGHGKWPAFAWAVFFVLRRFSFVSVELDVDAMREVRRTPVVFIGNNHYAVEGLHIGTRERLDRGELSLYIPKTLTRWGLLRMGLRALLGGLPPGIDLEATMAKAICIRSRRTSVHVAIDGEVQTMHMPLRYAIRPGALTVVVPRSSVTTKAF